MKARTSLAFKINMEKIGATQNFNIASDIEIFRKNARTLAPLTEYPKDNARPTSKQNSLPESLQPLSADQLGKFHKAPTNRRAGYVNRAIASGFNVSEHIGKNNNLKGASKPLAIAKRADHVLDRFGYNALSICTIMLAPPGTEKIINAAEIRETERLRHRKMPFDKHNAAVKYEIYKAYSSSEGDEKTKLAQTVEKFSVSDKFVEKVVAARGMVELEEIPTTNDTAQAGTDAGTAGFNIDELAR
jgi:hypothetical protein